MDGLWIGCVQTLHTPLRVLFHVKRKGLYELGHQKIASMFHVEPSTPEKSIVARLDDEQPNHNQKQLANKPCPTLQCQACPDN